MLGLGELAIILIVVILVLGAKRLPDLARSAGKSARILKSEVRAMKAENPPAPSPVTDAPGTPYPVRPGEPARVDPTGSRPTRAVHTEPGPGPGPDDRPPGTRPSTPAP